MGKARSTLKEARRKGYGDWGAYPAAVWGDSDPLTRDGSPAGTFADIAGRVFGPLLDHMEEA